MGSIQTKQSLPNKQNFDLLDYGYCTVWRRKSDQIQLMQQYPIQIYTPQRLQSYENMWPIRTKHSFLVNVHYFSHQKNSNLCGQLAQGYIFTQRIPYRLSQFSNIPLNLSISILKKCLQIFETLHQSTGLFLTRSTMIGFTQNLTLKLWYHTDYSQPQPQNQNCQSIHQMITSIIQSIQSVGEFCYYNYKFSDYIDGKGKGGINSFRMVNKLLDEFIIKMNIKCNEKFQNIRFYKKQLQGWEKFKSTNNHYTKFVSNKKFQNQEIKQNHENKSQNKTNHTSNISNIQTYKRVNNEKSFYQYLADNTTNSSRAIISNKNQTNQRGFNNNKNQTNQRGFNKNIQNNNLQNRLHNKQTKPIYQRQSLLTNRYLSPSFKNLNLQSPRLQHQYQQAQTIRFWKSTQKVIGNINTPVKSEKIKNMNNINLPVCFNQSSTQSLSYHVSPKFKQKNSSYYQNSFKNNNKISTQQYYGSGHQPIDQSAKFTYYSLKNLNKLNFIQKSAQISTTTQNYDKSLRSSLSLIQDLQFKQKQLINGRNFQKIV